MKTIKKIVVVLMSLMIILSAMPPQEMEAASNTISDIQNSNGKYKAAQWAIDNHYMQLYAGSKFQPGTLVMEKQMLEMIARLDSNYNFSYEPDMLYAYYADLNIPLYGVTNKSKRNANISRGHFARLFAAMRGLDLSEMQAVQYLYVNEITTGTTGKRTYADYMPNRNITRGDMAVFMYRSAQKGSVALEGLASVATGKDDSKITLPNGFVISDGTVELGTTPGKNTSDTANRPDVYKAVQNIKVSKNELNANGVDKALISIELKDSYGNDIPYEESLQFKVSSTGGATFTTSNDPDEKPSNIVYTDGPDLNVFVTAPRLTKSIKDTVRFELVSDDPKYYTYKNRVIETTVSYVPKAELRISYEVYDPNQPDWTGGTVTPPQTPPPALPEVVIPSGTMAATQNTEIVIGDFDRDIKTFEGEKSEVFAGANGQITQGNVDLTTTFYNGAELKFGGQIISQWLFEEILDRGINSNDKSAVGVVRVMYTLANGVPVYDILSNNLSQEFIAEFANIPGGDSFIYKAVVYLIRILPKADDITLSHEDSVAKIKAIYDKLGQTDKGNLQITFAQEIGKLEGAKSKIEVLLKGQELAQRPKGMERFTKVIVNVVAPGGHVITDYKGQVEITYAGTSRVTAFNQNTKDYNKGTGSAGSAVVYFDDIKYGNSTVTAKIMQQDPRYQTVLQELANKTVSGSVFANPKFEKNMCARDVEIAFVVDHSGSARKADANNYTAEKTKSLIKQMQQSSNHVIHFNSKGVFEMTTPSDKVPQSALKYQFDGNGTNIAKAIEVALGKFTSDRLTAKTIVLVTDGKTSKSQMATILKKAQDVKIITVSMGNYTEVNESLLKQIATETGGAYYNVADVHNLHGAYQAIVNSILCKTTEVDKSCSVGDALFNESSVKISRTNVILDARINTNCDNVYAVSVIFTTTGGSVTYDLQYRTSNAYRLTRYVNEFKPFNLYTNVEFQAFDKSGKLVATKAVDI